MEKVFTREWLGRTLTIKTGKLALQANAAVTVQYGETVVLATAVEAAEERAGLDFFPLMVEFEERLYAAGIIKGSRWIKREGRPSDDSVLTGRMIDRSIRPLFNQANRRDVQVFTTVLSVDMENDFDIVALVAASASATAPAPPSWQWVAPMASAPCAAAMAALASCSLMWSPGKALMATTGWTPWRFMIRRCAAKLAAPDRTSSGDSSRISGGSGLPATMR